MPTRRVQLALTLVLGVLIAITARCPASKKPSKWETRLANMAKDVVIPIEAKNLKNPLASNTDAVQEGQQIFMASCAMCHGTDGHARTGLGLAMYPPALDMTSPHVQHWTEAELFWIIQNGAERREMISGKAIQKACESFCILNPSELISPKVL